MKVIIHPSAWADVEQYIQYLEEQHAPKEKIVEFFRAIESAKQSIERNPETWSRVINRASVRKFQIPKFRMQVFYTIHPDGNPIILEFAGAGLQPRWAERL